MRASEALQAARALIEDPARWCSGGFSHGDAHCAVGAYNRVRTGVANVSGEPNDFGRWLLSQAAYVMDDSLLMSPIWVNDQLGHAAVLQMYDVATSMALSDEAGSRRGCR